MFLKSITLENIRCFRSAQINFDHQQGVDTQENTIENVRKWTVIIGENGVGKSTLLKAVCLITAGSDALTELLGDVDSWITVGKKEGSIQATLVTKGGNERKVSFVFARGHGIREFLKQNDKGLDDLDRALKHTDRNYPVFAYGASRRLGANNFNKGSSYYSHARAASVASLFDTSVELNPLESWAMQLDYRKNDGLDTVKDVLSDFLRDVTFSHIDKEAGALMFQTEDGLVPLRSLSDGYRSIAAWIGDALYRICGTFDDYRDPLSARGLLVIDEVDLHLHPAWQRRLVNFLDEKLPNMQIVVTTHSPVVAQSSPLGALHSCHRTGEGIIVAAFQDDPKRLPLSTLLASSAFGGVSDESDALENWKNDYREIYQKLEKAEDDDAKLVAIKERIGVQPTIEVDLNLLSKEQMKLFKKALGQTEE